MAEPVIARNRATQLITRAGEGRRELVLVVIGISFRSVSSSDDPSFGPIVLRYYGPQG
jgi:hypothetical protein